MNIWTTDKKRSLNRLFLITVMLFLVTAIGGAAISYGAENPVGPLTESEKAAVSQINNVFRRAVEQVSPAVVSIQVSKNGADSLVPQEFNFGLGSGCIIDKRGYIITNNHVVEDTDEVEVILADGKRFKAIEKMFDPATDLAIIKIDPQGEELPQARFGDSDKLKVGDFVLAIGNPFGLDQTVTAGIVSYKGRETRILGQWGIEDFIQTDADINKGNSGGPLVNLYGEVVGVNSNILTPTGISAGYGFAVPSKMAQYVANQLIENKEVKRGWLGVRMIDLGDIRNMRPELLKSILTQKQLDNLEKINDDAQGVFVTEVVKDSPADQAGIKDSDLIIEIDDQKMETSRKLRDYIATLAPETVIQCKLLRDTKLEQKTVTLGDRGVARAEQEKETVARNNFPLPENWPFAPGQPQMQKPKLGIGVEMLTEESAQDFGYENDALGMVVIRYVEPDSLADKFGLKVGDLIISINDQKISSVEQLKKFVAKADLENEGLTLKIRNHQGTQEKTIVSSGI